MRKFGWWATESQRREIALRLRDLARREAERATAGRFIDRKAA